ncbi:MAG: RagB/SusD family nutrient uptake outer membrane protein [Prevotella sp.]|nr:RagB/SusD family nutrient uptake outer membrane protein [Prevotella sp.]
MKTICNLYNKVKTAGAVTLLLTAMLSACDLDQYPYSEVVPEAYVKDAESVNTLVLGCYNGLQHMMHYEWAVTELRSDNARMYGNNSTSNTTKLVEQLDQNTIGTEHEWVTDYWDACYSLIARVNSMMENLHVVDDAALRNQYEAEGRFLRALVYFNLVRLWGPTFIVTTKVSSDVARYMQRSTVDEVYALIEGDLETVISGNMLPEVMTGGQIGRADLTAAKALLAKVYATHYRKGSAQYARAAQLCQEVLASSRVGNPQTAADLEPFASIFSIDNEMNKEIIFAVRYLSGNVGLGSPFGNMFAPLNNGANVIIGTCNNYNTPSDNLMNAYQNEGDAVRFNVNISQGYYNPTTGATVAVNYVKKYTNPVTTQFDGESDWPLIRVGDIALLYAELSNELNGPTSTAFQYLNMVRERAGLPAYTSSELSNTYDFREAVRKERRLELAFENHRWFDLLRWGNAATTINSYLSSESFYAGYSYTVNPIAEWQTMLPVPVSVFNINPDVAQNAGY